MRALIIEDDYIHSEVLNKILKNYNLECDVADDVAQAHDFFDRNQYEYVFCDICLPDGDGFEVLSQFRHNRPETVFIGMSGFGQDGLDYICQKIRINEFLFKPFDEQEIGEILGVDARTAVETIPHRYDSQSLEKVYKLFDDPSLFTELIRKFQKDLAHLQKTVGHLVKTQKYQEAREIVHPLCSNAKLLGLGEMGSILAKIESALVHENLALLPEQIEKLGPEEERCRKFIYDFLLHL